MKKFPIFIIFSTLILSGCQSLNSTDYTKAKDPAALKFPPKSLPVSDRYDIPEITGKHEDIITEVKPPDY